MCLVGWAVLECNATVSVNMFRIDNGGLCSRAKKVQVTLIYLLYTVYKAIRKSFEIQ